MKYKYKKGQIFGKKLQVSEEILSNVYSRSLSFNDFIKYDLENKIPISCLNSPSRKIVEKYGIEKAKTLDWELLEKEYTAVKSLREIDSLVEDINTALYEKIKDEIRPCDYSSEMKKKYIDRLFEIESDTDYELTRKMEKFNRGETSLTELIHDWTLYKDKDLSYCLLRDRENKNHITDSDLKQFMANYEILAPLIVDNNDIYTFITTISTLTSEEEKHKYIKQFTDNILSNTHRTYGDYRPPIQPTDEEYKEIFKYSSIGEYLKTFDENDASKIMGELRTLPQDYVFNIPIPFSVLLNSDVLRFVGIYGLKNIVDFDDECGHFFTKNNCEMLKLMHDMYLHFAENEHDPNRKIFTKNNYDENGNYIDRPYTKDEFYEAMRRMIIYGPSNWKYADKAPDYRNMTGEFRRRNAELFIAEQAPEELQKLFYTKQITPHLLREHPEFIQYLNGKDLGSCFKERYIKVEKSDESYSNENFYKFISSKANFNDAMNFIIEYSDVFDIVFNSETSKFSQYEISASVEDSFNEIQKRINDVFKEIIIEKRIAYPQTIPQNFITNYQSMFLSSEAPKELQEAFYNRTINSEFILSNPIYKNYLKNVDLEALYPYMLVSIIKENDRYDNGKINLIGAIKQTFDPKDSFDIMLSYGKYIESVFEVNQLQNFKYNSSFSKDDLLNELDSSILQAITDGNIKYDESIPNHFKNNNPTLLLSRDIPQDIRDKFYNREFSTTDFIQNPDLIDMFAKTNIAFAFPCECVWTSQLFSKEDLKKANFKRLKVIGEMNQIENNLLREKFQKYVEENQDKLDMERLGIIRNVLKKLEFSNSSELRSFCNNFAEKLINLDDPLASLEKIERIFIQNNLPFFAKMFLSFQTIYPDFKKEYGIINKFDFSDTSRIAPQLKDQSLPNIGYHLTPLEKRFRIIYNDLLRITYRSGSIDLMEYLNQLETGNDLFMNYVNSGFKQDNFSKEDKQSFDVFMSHLETMYENLSKKDIHNLPLEEKSKILYKTFEPTPRYDFKDRIVRTFCYSAGITTFNQLKELVISSKKEADERGRNYAMELESRPFKFEEGDFVRGMGDFQSLSGSLPIGNVCKEQLITINQTSDTDTTPLDIDITRLNNKPLDIYHAIRGTPTGFGFGNVFQIIKKDNPNFTITRDKEGNLTNEPYNPLKAELFGTQITGTGGYETHWGARTGVAMTDIDYLLYKQDRIIDRNKPYDENGDVNYTKVDSNIETNSQEKKDYELDLDIIKYEIAKNGYYLPVIDFSGKLIYSVEEYENIRNMMQGLSHYGVSEYKLSEHLSLQECPISSELTLPSSEWLSSQLEESNQETIIKREKIKQVLKPVFDEFNLSIKEEIDGDLTPGSVEFIDTGSTGRGTNKPHDGDFDFLLRLDNDLLLDSDKKNKFMARLHEEIEKYHPKKSTKTDKGDYRFKGVKLDDETTIDLDLSFVGKTNKVTYSSDMCVKDRLATIKKQYPEQYDLVVANIIQAKMFLKSQGVYKPFRSDATQGGLGGIGIENWVLQHGGSFLDAATSFVEASEGKDFAQFKKDYQIWDFGANHFADRKNANSWELYKKIDAYPYDNFVTKNMSEAGYNKMKQALKQYLVNYDHTYLNQQESIEETRTR